MPISPEFPRYSHVCEIDICELLPAVVADDKAGVGFLNRPGRREAAGGHSAVLRM
jgi:hypothetical protein